MKTIVVAGSRGLIGRCVVDKLKKENYDVVCSDPKENRFINLFDSLVLIDLFNTYEIAGLINCAYPKGFENHAKFFMMLTEDFSYRLKENNSIGGGIVNIASIYGMLGPDERIYKNTNMFMPAWYAAAKGAIIAHSRCLATQYAKYNIRINCIAAGGVFDEQDENFVEAYNNRVPMNRMATPEDIADVAVFLVDEKSKYITGQCIPVDGGLMAW